MADETKIGTKKVEPVAGLAPRTVAELRRDIGAACVIFLLGFALYLLPALCGRPLSGASEARLAVTAREMVRSGDYVTPQLGGEPRLQEPPLPAWLTAGAARLLSWGKSLNSTIMTRATYLPPALLGALALFIVVLYGSIVFGRPAGIIAGLVLGFSLLFCRGGQSDAAGMTLLFACAGMSCSAAWLTAAPRPGLLAAVALGVSLGLGLLTRPCFPLPLLAVLPVLWLVVWCLPLPLLAGPVLIEVLIRRRFSGRKVLLFLVALVVAAAIVLPWYLAVAGRYPDAWEGRLQGAMIGSGGQERNAHWYFYFEHLFRGLLPWTIPLAAAWPLRLARCQEHKRALFRSRAAGAPAGALPDYFLLFGFCGIVCLARACRVQSAAAASRAGARLGLCAQ